MKSISRAAALAGSAALGYAGVTYLRHPSQTSNHADHSTGNPTTGTAVPADPSGRTLSSTGSPNLPAVTQTTGSALAGQIRTALKLQGIDPAWAEALSAADTNSFPGLLEKLSSLSGSHKATLSSILLARWAALDPLGGAAFLKSQKDDENLSALFQEWGQIDFEAAAAKAPEYGDHCVRRTLFEKARLDPAGFLTWATAHPDIIPSLSSTRVRGRTMKPCNVSANWTPTGCWRGPGSFPKTDGTMNFPTLSPRNWPNAARMKPSPGQKPSPTLRVPGPPSAESPGPLRRRNRTAPSPCWRNYPHKAAMRSGNFIQPFWPS